MKWQVVALIAFLIIGCGRQQEETYQPMFSERGAGEPKKYIVGIHPLRNPKRQVEDYGPLIDYLNATILQARFRLEASRNYEEFETKLYSAWSFPRANATIVLPR
jgi:phosphonate transport system substrate-binding protein